MQFVVAKTVADAREQRTAVLYAMSRELTVATEDTHFNLPPQVRAQPAAAAGDPAS